MERQALEITTGAKLNKPRWKLTYLLGILGWISIGVAQAATPVATHEYQLLKRCPFNASELNAATGLKWELVEPVQLSGAPPIPTKPENGAMYFTCHAVDGNAAANMTIQQVWFEPKTAPARIKALKLRDFSKAETIANDPDGAVWLSERQGAKQKLAYQRGNVFVTLWIDSVPAQAQAKLREKMLKLRRLP